MPKMKTNRSAAKRFKKTGSGRIKRRMAFGRHMLNGKSSKRRRNFRSAELVSDEDAPRVKHMLPY